MVRDTGQHRLQNSIVFWIFRQEGDQAGDGWIAYAGTCRNYGSPRRVPSTEHSGNQEFGRYRRRIQLCFIQSQSTVNANYITKHSFSKVLSWTTSFVENDVYFDLRSHLGSGLLHAPDARHLRATSPTNW